MPIDFWPIIRAFLVMAILLSAMYEPKKKRRNAEPVKPVKEEIYDAEYDQLD